MNPVAFIDANVPIYAAGREHSYKEPCARVLRVLADAPQSFVTDSEVLQEIMHRYLASGRWTSGREVVRAFAEAMSGRVEPVLGQDVILATELADRHPGVSARDLVHAAVMRRLEVSRVISADTDFDRLEGIERMDPARIEEWEDSIPTADEDPGNNPR